MAFLSQPGMVVTRVMLRAHRLSLLLRHPAEPQLMIGEHHTWSNTKTPRSDLSTVTTKSKTKHSQEQGPFWPAKPFSTAWRKLSNIKRTYTNKRFSADLTNYSIFRMRIPKELEMFGRFHIITKVFQHLYQWRALKTVPVEKANR